MWPTCWAEATPDKLEEQLALCEIWDARPQTKGTACEAQVEGLGQCDEGRQNGNSCFKGGVTSLDLDLGAIRAFQADRHFPAKEGG